MPKGFHYSHRIKRPEANKFFHILDTIARLQLRFLIINPFAITKNSLVERHLLPWSGTQQRGNKGILYAFASECYYAALGVQYSVL
jgi:hypothetical protein